MWANHHWTNIHPWKSGTELESGHADAQQFEAATDYMIERYFGHPSYLRLDGRPYLSIYELKTLVEGLGGVERTRAALDGLRLRAARAGHGDLHLNAIAQERRVLPQHGGGLDGSALVDSRGFDSATSYVWLNHVMPTLLTPCADMLAQAEQGWDELAARFNVPYFPNVTVGWVSSPEDGAVRPLQPGAGIRTPTSSAMPRRRKRGKGSSGAERRAVTLRAHTEARPEPSAGMARVMPTDECADLGYRQVGLDQETRRAFGPDPVQVRHR